MSGIQPSIHVQQTLAMRLVMHMWPRSLESFETRMFRLYRVRFHADREYRYWNINYVRVYQLVDPAAPPGGPEYIASMQPPNSVTAVSSSVVPAASPTASLCPTYNFTTILDGGLTYEIECSFDPPGPDLPPPYAGYIVRTFEDCVAGCTYWNTMNGTNLCGGVSYDASVPFCYYKKYIDQTPKYRSGFAGARLIYYGYPQITDDPRSQTVSAISTFIEIIPTPQFYRPLTATPSLSTTFILTSTSISSATASTIAPPPLGTATNETVRPTVDPGTPTVSYSGSQSIPVTNVTSTGGGTTSTTTQIQLTSLATDSSSLTTNASASTVTFTSHSTSTVMISTSEITTTVQSQTQTNTFTMLPLTTKSPTSIPNTSMFSDTHLSTSISSSSIVPVMTTSSDSIINTTRSSTTSTDLSTSTTINDLPGPTQVANFRYAGCKASRFGRDLFQPANSSGEMTLERCIASCSGSYYAAINGR